MNEIEVEAEFDAMLDDSNDIIKIGTLTYLPSQVLKSTDPIAYRIGKYDFADMFLDGSDDDDE